MFKCDCVCHRRGLNPWIKECPRCECDNVKYDPAAKCDFPYEEVPSLETTLALFLPLVDRAVQMRKEKESNGEQSIPESED